MVKYYFMPNNETPDIAANSHPFGRKPRRLSTAANKGGLRALAIPHAVWDGSYPLVLADGWALTADENQWMLRQARGRDSKWQPVSFVSSNTDVLRCVLCEEDVELSPEGKAALNGLKLTFCEWRGATG